MFLGRFHLQRHPDVEIRGRKKGHMRERMQVNGHAGKTRSEAGATPSCRKIAARSLRASGVTPAQAAQEIAARVLAARRGAATEL